MEAVIFIGVQGSGKTTFYRHHFFDTHVRISLDMLRTRRREQVLLEACLEAGQAFVVDNTNPLVRDRERYIARSHAAGFRVLAYFFQCPLEDAIRRNNQRRLKQRVPVPAIVSAFKRLQVPTLDEGFDKVYTVSMTQENEFVVDSGTPKEGHKSSTLKGSSAGAEPSQWEEKA
jgi:predicted kinase